MEHLRLPLQIAAMKWIIRSMTTTQRIGSLIADGVRSDRSVLGLVRSSMIAQKSRMSGLP